ncbi:MAG: hypothetical protein ACLTC0_30065, partial [Eisenbergiella massiliensis]|uniref:hypothetical protein n=1 Tax=Eisenbergiella massiliensis TaxID=1720294 RepID=UPI0039929992
AAGSRQQNYTPVKHTGQGLFPFSSIPVPQYQPIHGARKLFPVNHFYIIISMHHGHIPRARIVFINSFSSCSLPNYTS